MTPLQALVAHHTDPEERAELRAAMLTTGRLRFAAYDRAVAEEEAARAGIVKRCGACERLLPASSYGRNAARPDGLQTWCKQCRRGPRRPAE
ncbi:hypothetical protein ACWEOW_13380 [Monashia sp. NPDC004114]